MNPNLSKPETFESDVPNEERLAKLTGFNPQKIHPGDSSRGNTASSLLSDEDLEEQITRHSFASSPLSKLVFVAGAVFFVVFLASLFLSQFQSPGESVFAHEPTEARDKEQSPLLSPENQDKEKAELLSELALREQKERLRELEAQKADKPKPVRTPVEKPRTVSIHPTPVQGVARQPPPQSQILPVQYPLPRPVSVSPSSAQTTQSNPSQLWEQLSQVGSFGGYSLGASPSKTQEGLPPIYEPRTASSNAVANTSQLRAISSTERNSSPVSYSEAIPFGQSVSAILETTISWEGSGTKRTAQPSDDRYIVTLNEPLKDKLGNTEIVAGSQLVVGLEKGSNALVTLTAESIIVNGIETKLPQGALKIRGVEGEPLIAQMTTLGGNDNTQALADVLSIAGDFADIPGSRSISSLYRTITGGGNQRFGSGITATVFFLPQGTPLEVFVNKTFSLDVQEQPLELDLGAIHLSESSIAIESTDKAQED